MSKKNYRLKGNQRLSIIPLSDLHVGSEQFNKEYFEYCIDIIDKIKTPIRIYLGGDLIEGASKKTGNGAFHTTMTVEKQVQTVIDYLKPFKKDIIFSATGNHEQRMVKDFDNNVMYYIAKALGCDYGYQYIDCFNVNGEPIHVYIQHGKGSSAYAHLAQGKMIRGVAHVDSKIYIEGHNHRLDFFPQVVRTASNDLGITRKYYVFSGSFLRYKGYPEQMSLPPLPEAFQILSVNKDRIVWNNPYYIDERRPDLFEM